MKTYHFLALSLKSDSMWVNWDNALQYQQHRLGGILNATPHLQFVPGGHICTNAPYYGSGFFGSLWRGIKSGARRLYSAFIKPQMSKALTQLPALAAKGADTLIGKLPTPVQSVVNRAGVRDYTQRKTAQLANTVRKRLGTGRKRKRVTVFAPMARRRRNMRRMYGSGFQKVYY